MADFFANNWVAIGWNDSKHVTEVIVRKEDMVTMPGFAPSLKGAKGRVRTPVGHRYLEALQLHASGDTDRESTSSATTSNDGDDGLTLLILGMTSGTAMGDIDFALCRFMQANPEAPLVLDIIQYDSVVMPSRIRTEVLSMLQQDAAPPSTLSQMDVELGQTFANAVHIFAKRHTIALDDVDLIGSGGQLVSLIGRPPVGQHRSNMCLGEGAVISAKTGVTTVSDYRTAEQAVGRQGAPLFAYLVGLLLHHPTRLQICITIGGITTVCFVPSDANGGIDAMYDWDTGPGTVLIDAAMRFYGFDPLLPPPNLVGGRVCQPIIDQVLNSNEYLKTRPPKTTAREIFGDIMAFEIITACQGLGCSPTDIIATLSRLTTASIAQQLLLFGPGACAINNSDIVIDGRGMYNPSFITDLQASFPGANFGNIEQKTGVPANAKKAVGFAMQAMEAVLGRALPVTANADVRRPNTITGKIAPGLGWRGVMERCAGFGGRGRGWEGLPEVRELIVKRREGDT